MNNLELITTMVERIGLDSALNCGSGGGMDALRRFASDRCSDSVQLFCRGVEAMLKVSQHARANHTSFDDWWILTSFAAKSLSFSSEDGFCSVFTSRERFSRTRQPSPVKGPAYPFFLLLSLPLTESGICR